MRTCAWQVLFPQYTKMWATQAERRDPRIPERFKALLAAGATRASSRETPPRMRKCARDVGS